MSEEWGPWIEHDQSGVPSEIRIGMFIECQFEGRRYDGGPREVYYGSGLIEAYHMRVAWWTAHGPSCRFATINKFRIRKPEGMTLIEEALVVNAVPSREEEPA